MTEVDKLKKWFDQEFKELERSERLYQQLNEKQQQSARDNIKVYNQTWKETYSSIQWTWYVVGETDEVVRGYLKVNETSRDADEFKPWTREEKADLFLD